MTERTALERICDVVLGLVVGFAIGIGVLVSLASRWTA